jgi:hypothetical protein
LNKPLLPPPHLQAISTEGAVELTLTGGEGLPSGVEGRTLALHDKNPELGNKVWSGVVRACVCERVTGPLPAPWGGSPALV